MSDTRTMDKTAELRDGLYRTGREIWLAGLGVVATVGEEARSAFETLVERGKAVEARDDKTVVGRAMGEMGQQVRKVGQKVEDGLQETSKAVLHRFGVPSHAEIQALISRVEQLSAKVDTIASKEVADVQET